MTRSQSVVMASQAGKRARGDGTEPSVQAEQFQEMLDQAMSKQAERFLQALSKQKDELLTSFQAHVAGLEAQHNAEKEAFRAEIAALRADLNQLRGVGEARDRQSRSTHIVMKGFAEQPAEQLTPAMVGQHIPGTEQTITEVRRLGRQGAGTLPRPVLIKFSSVAAEHAAYKHSKTLRSQKIYLDSDLTPQQRDQRTKKRDRFQHLKTQGMKPFWREERLFCYINGTPREDTGSSDSENIPPPPPPPDMPPSSSTPSRPASYAQATAPTRTA